MFDHADAMLFEHAEHGHLESPLLMVGECGPRSAHEEVGRAERYGTKLSCLLVVIDNLGEMAREHGVGLAEQTVAYIAEALAREVRRFDRIGWMTAEEDVWAVPEYLCTIRHTPVMPLRLERHLSRVDARLFSAGLLGRAV